MRSIAHLAAILFLALPALCQSTVKPIGAGTASYSEGTTTTGTFTCQGNGNIGDINFTAPGRTDEQVNYTLGGPGVSYYRVSRNNPHDDVDGPVPTNDYYVFEAVDGDEKTFTWKKYWCQGFLTNGTPIGPTLTGTGSVTYP